MAEERLIDDDINKNKKYKIRKNEDGEDELYIDESYEEETEDDESVVFNIPEFTEDDEEAAVLTPEQLAAREEARRQEEERRKQFVAENVAKAKELVDKGDFDEALYNLNSAENTDGKCGEVFALKIKVLTRNFTDFTALDECVDCSEGIRNYCTPDQKAEIASLSEPLESHTQKLEEQVAALHVEVEEKKSERRALFAEDRKKTVKLFTFTTVPFIVCLVLAISFGSVMFARQDGVNLILTIVFAAFALVFFIATLFTAHKMWSAMQKFSLNEKNTSTRLGREYEELRATVKKLNTVLTSLKE